MIQHIKLPAVIYYLLCYFRLLFHYFSFHTILSLCSSMLYALHLVLQTIISFPSLPLLPTHQNYLQVILDFKTSLGPELLRDRFRSSMYGA